MADKNLIGQAVLNKEEIFKRLRDWVCAGDGTGNYSYNYSTTGIGWTLYDFSYATDKDTVADGDWFVVYSAGESGYDDLYFKVELLSNYIKTSGYLSWNSSTNAGINQYNTTSNWTNTNVTASTVYFYGNLNFILGISYYAGNYYGCLQGLSDNTMYPRTVTTCSSSLSSGSDVSITVASAPADWAADRYIFIRDTTNIKRIMIKTIVGNTITADLTVSFAAGAKLCSDLVYFCQGNVSMSSTFYTLISRAGTINASTLLQVPGTMFTFADPDNMNSEYIIRNVYIADGTNVKYGGYLDNICDVGEAGLTSLDVLVDQNGVSWRYFDLNASKFICVKEV